MSLTTIAISSTLRDKIKEFGLKGESYEDILSRFVEHENDRLLRSVFMSDENTTTIEDALERAKKKWK
ncbi:MAG: hypothetical protein ACOCXG_00330 [Nanoarchaeota archaeon]